jgi:hypothetical protein
MNAGVIDREPNERHTRQNAFFCFLEQPAYAALKRKTNAGLNLRPEQMNFSRIHAYEVQRLPSAVNSGSIPAAKVHSVPEGILIFAFA